VVSNSKPFRFAWAASNANGAFPVEIHIDSGTHVLALDDARRLHQELGEAILDVEARRAVAR
jgi:hypothetical protein